MQKTLKKLGTVMMGSLLMGATLLGPASAAVTLDQYPAPFATVDGISSVIVVGATAATEDVVGAINIGAKLAQTGAEEQTVTVTCEAGAADVAGGVQIKSVGEELYLDKALDTVMTRRITSSDLPNVLADGKVIDTNQDETKFTQQILVGANTVTFGIPTSDVTTPMLYLGVPTTTNLTTMKVLFENAVDYTKLAGKTMAMFGKDYTFASANADLQKTRLVLYGGGEKMTVDAGGAEKSVELEGKTVAVQMTSWTSATIPEAVLTVNGVTDTYAQGSYISISGFDSKIYVKKVTVTKTPSAAGGAGESAYAELFVGSDKLVFASDVVKSGKNEETIQGTTAVVTNSSLTVTYAPTDDTYVEVGGEIIEPVFDAVKMQFTGIVPAADSSDREVIVVKQDGSNNMAMSFPSATGTLNLPFVDYDTGSVELADKSGNDIVLNETTAIAKNQYFVIGNADTGSRVLQVTAFDVGSTNKTSIKDLGSGSSTQYTYNAVDLDANVFYVAGVSFGYAVDFNAKTMTVDMDGDGAKTTNGVPVYTAKGAKIELALNATGTQVNVTVTEDPENRVSSFTDDGTITVISEYNIGSNRYDISGYGSTGIALSDPVAAGLERVGDTNVYKTYTLWGTPIELSGDTTNPLNAKISYADAPAIAQVFIGEPEMEVATSATDGTTKTATVSVTVPAIPTAGIAKLDSKVSDAEKLGNLILVGGPAVNTLVAELAADGKAMSANDWRAEDETGERLNKDKAKIQVVEDAFGEGSVALVVAGYSAADTGNAAYVLQNYNTFSSALDGKTEVTVTGITVADVS